MNDSAVQAVVRDVRGLVLDGGYRAGDRLPGERELAARAGVARPAVREAVNRLVAAGMLEVRHGSGTYVADVDLASVVRVRLRLEPLAAELAARARTAADLDALYAAEHALRDTVAEAGGFAAADAALHRAVAAAAHDAVLEGLLARLEGLAAVSRTITSPSRALRTGAVEDLGALLDAIVDRAPARAAAAMTRHLERVAATIGA